MTKTSGGDAGRWTRKARFARAMARAELGRAYWGEGAEEDFREAKMRKPPRPNGKKG